MPFGASTPEPAPGMAPGDQEIIHVDDRVVACDGGSAGLGHPRVWLRIVHEQTFCPYCSRVFVLNARGKRDRALSMDASAEPRLHLVLVDGSGFIFRAFHALPPMTRPDGTPVNAVFGFTNMLARLLKDHVGTHLAVIFDAGRTTFRNRIYDAYKAQRPEPPPELVPQFALVRDATAAFNVPAIELADWEADDLIAAYTRATVEAGGKVTVVSSDKDLMQLIKPGVVMQDPIKQKSDRAGRGAGEIRLRPGEDDRSAGPDGGQRRQRARRPRHRPEDRLPVAGANSATWKPCWRRRRR